MKRYILPLLLLSLSFLTFGQQEAQFSQYMNNNYLVNPAVTGMEYYFNVNTGFRNQWNSLNGTLNTYYLTAHKRLPLINNDHSLPVRGAKVQPKFGDAEPAELDNPHGVGAYVFYDDQGVSAQNGLGASYAYHLDMDQLHLSFGVSAGVVRYVLDGDLLNPLDPSDELLNNQRVTANTADISAGIWLNGKDFYAGIAANQLSQSKIQVNTSSSENKQNNHYNITGGYRFRLNDEIALMPSVLFKYVQPAPVSMDLNLVASYQDRYSLGASFRNEDAIVLIAGLHLNTFYLGYAYDINTSNLSTYNNGSHEISLGVGLGAMAANGKTLYW